MSSLRSLNHRRRSHSASTSSTNHREPSWRGSTKRAYPASSGTADFSNLNWDLESWRSKRLRREGSVSPFFFSLRSQQSEISSSSPLEQARTTMQLQIFLREVAADLYSLHLRQISTSFLVRNHPDSVTRCMIQATTTNFPPILSFLRFGQTLSGSLGEVSQKTGKVSCAVCAITNSLERDLTHFLK